MKATRYAFFSLCLLVNASSFAQKSHVVSNYDNILHNVAKMAEVIHYKAPLFDDAFSRRLFNAYFESLDPGKMLFLQSDKNFFQHYETRLDDELRGGRVSFFKAVDTLYARRITESRLIAEELLNAPFSITSDDVYIAERSSVQFPASLHEKKDLWRKYLTYQLLNQYEDISGLDSVQNKLNFVDTSVERKARENLQRIQKRSFERLEQQAVEEENFGKYINSMIHLMDPHSNYFLPIDKREFQEDLSGIYYGIGALLQEADGTIRIAELMIGGPAWRSGQVEKGDVIVGVTQETGAMQDVVGFGMQDIIKLTRGKKNTKLTITFKKADGKIKKVTLTRDALQLEDTFARSAIIDDSIKIGYVYLPKFYTSFDEQSGRSCAMDIAVELEKLKNEQVKGIIIDIRDNGGGSLEEVIKMVGLFIKEGPVVQVKSRDKKPEIAGINNKDLSYSGPVVVLVNELSASASEIFAAAIQDYKRGVIVGSPSTFGKGTVQRAYRVPGAGWVQSESDLGSVHLTLQKYYRVNGDATQLKGIIPDITLPGLYQFYNVQEKNYPNALPWDEIKSASYNTVSDTGFLFTVREKSLARQKATPAFNILQENLHNLSESNTRYSLNLNKFKEERKQVRETVARIRSNSVRLKEMKIHNTIEDDLQIKKREQFRIDNNNAWLKRLQKDLYLGEAVYVMKDLILAKNS